MTPRSNIARNALALGVVGSLAGNTAWAWPHGPVLVGVGVGMSLVLPIGVTLWRASGAVTGWARTERAAVMGFIAFGAALYSLVHATLLLHDEGLPWLIAWLPASVVEALVVSAVRVGTPVKAQVKAPSRPPAPAKPRRDRPVTAPSGPHAVPDAPPDDETAVERTRRLARDRQAARRDRQRQEAAR